jgi:hypothetical protein
MALTNYLSDASCHESCKTASINFIVSLINNLMHIERFIFVQDSHYFARYVHTTFPVRVFVFLNVFIPHFLISYHFSPFPQERSHAS